MRKKTKLNEIRTLSTSDIEALLLLDLSGLPHYSFDQLNDDKDDAEQTLTSEVTNESIH